MKHFRIEIRDKHNVYDAVAEGLKKDIQDLGIKGVKDAGFVQVYTLFGNIDKKVVKTIAEEILTDKVSQEYNMTTGYGKKSRTTHIVEVAYNPGVMDPVQESVLKAIRDMKIGGIATLRT